jgi:O-acetyl-ADP-ribose deacetylase
LLTGSANHALEGCDVKAKINESEIELIEGDITEQNTDAIVNAANRTLLGGGGVDGSIHRAGGVKIMEECRRLGGCDTGDAKITVGGYLPAAHVIHTVGPVYRGGKHHEAEMLAKCYTRCLEVASENNVHSISFPSISTGAYGYPLEDAAHIALRAAIDYLKSHSDIKLVRFVLYGKHSLGAYEAALQDLIKQEGKEVTPEI